MKKKSQKNFRANVFKNFHVSETLQETFLISKDEHPVPTTRPLIIKRDAARHVSTFYTINN